MKDKYFNMTKEELIKEIEKLEKGGKAIDESTKRLEDHRNELLSDINKCEEAIQKGVDAMKVLATEITEMRMLWKEKYGTFIM